MAAETHSFIDIAALAAVRAHLAAGDAIVVLNVELDSVVWTNGDGAALLGFNSIEAAIGSEPGLGRTAMRQISATPGYPDLANAATIGVRITSGTTSQVVMFKASRLALPGDDAAIMLVAPLAAAGSRSAAEISARIVSGFADPSTLLAIIDATGGIKAASAGFERLGISGPALAGIASALTSEADGVVKRILRVDERQYPVGLARLTDHTCLLITVDDPSFTTADAPSHVLTDGTDDTVPIVPVVSEASAPEPQAEQSAPAATQTTESVPLVLGPVEGAILEPVEHTIADPTERAAAEPEESAAAEPSESTVNTADLGASDDAEAAPVAEIEAGPTSETAAADSDIAAPIAGSPSEAHTTAAAPPAPSDPITELTDTHSDLAPDGEDDWYFGDDEAPAAPAIDRSAAPVRFIWRTDAEGRFSALSPEFANVVGAAASAVVGRSFAEVSALLGLDPDGEIGGLLDRRDTWSGRSVLWPIAGTDLKIPVDLAALPAYGRDRKFEGFRGFGVARAADAMVDPDGIGLALTQRAALAIPAEALAPPDGEQQPEDTSPDAPEASAATHETASSAEPTVAAEPVPLEQTVQAELTAPVILPMPERRLSDKIIRLSEHRYPPIEKALTPVERNAFREIGERLKKTSEPVEDTAQPAEPAPIEPSQAIEPTTPAEAEAAAPAQSGDAFAASDAANLDAPAQADVETNTIFAGDAVLEEPAPAIVDAGPTSISDNDPGGDNPSLEATISTDEPDAPLLEIPAEDPAYIAEAETDADAQGDDVIAPSGDFVHDAVDEVLAEADEPALQLFDDRTEELPESVDRADAISEHVGEAGSTSEHEPGDGVEPPVETSSERIETAAEATPESVSDGDDLADAENDTVDPLPSELPAEDREHVADLATGENDNDPVGEADANEAVAEITADDVTVERDADEAIDVLSADAAPEDRETLAQSVTDEPQTVAQQLSVLEANFGGQTEAEFDEGHGDLASFGDDPRATLDDLSALDGVASGEIVRDLEPVAHATDISETAVEEALEPEPVNTSIDATPPPPPVLTSRSLLDFAVEPEDAISASTADDTAPAASEQPAAAEVTATEIAAHQPEAGGDISSEARSDATSPNDGDEIRIAAVPDASDDAAMPAGDPSQAYPELADDGGPAIEQPAPRADTSILAQLPIPLLIHSGETLHYANGAFLDLTGYSSLDEFAANGGLDAIFAGPPDDRAEGDSRVMLRSRSEGEVPVSAYLRSVPWQGGKALMLALTRHPAPPPPVTVQDPELQARVAEMRTIIDTATDGVVLISADGNVRSISRPAEALFGQDSDEVAGRSFASLFAPESQKSAQDYLNGLSDNGVASVLNDGREVFGREAQGRLIPLFMTIGRLPGKSGFCAVLRDITQWKSVEQDLNQARAQAERTSSQKSDFLARVSHEIRTPLNAIIGFSELMLDEKFGPVSNDRYRDYLRDINRSGNHVLDLVNDLLDISKIEAGEQEMDYQAVALNDTLAETVALMQPQANRERVIIRSSFASKLPEIVADTRSLRQIALNILSNAVRYTQAGGQVIVSTAYEANGDVVMRVRDTGIGMSAAEIEQALKPFKQLNALKRQRGDGTGLGLPLTKAMVEANRAKFSIHSTPGEGTLVEVTFPSTRVLAN